MNKPQSFQELVDTFGNPADFGKTDQSKLEWEKQWMTQWRSDKWNGSHIPMIWPADAPFKNLYVNRELIPYLDKAFELLIQRGLFHEIKTYGGCWNIRPIRGTTDKWSLHSFGIAIDLNELEMPLGSLSKWSKEFVDTMKEAGFTFGGDFKRSDPMHWQFCDGA